MYKFVRVCVRLRALPNKAFKAKCLWIHYGISRHIAISIIIHLNGLNVSQFLHYKLVKSRLSHESLGEGKPSMLNTKT